MLAENGELLANDDRIGKELRFHIGIKDCLYLTSNYYIIYRPILKP